MNPMLEELRWKKFPVLSDGFVTLVDVMGDDAAVVQAARVSYGKDVREEDDGHPGWRNDYGTPIPNPAYERRQKTLSEERRLIRYMMSHNHGTPFEMAEVKLLVRVPMDTWRQWIRHRTANVNEYSTRYTTAIDSRDVTAEDAWRLQSKANKQGSSQEFLEVDGPEIAGMSTGKNLSADEAFLHEQCQRVYQTRLKAGIANEQARKDLPLSTYTEAYWKCDLRNILHFLGLRMDSHAQKEIRDYANIIGNEIIAKLFPVTWEAWNDYDFQSMKLSAPEILAIRSGDRSSLTGRERGEFEAKLKRLGIPV